MLYAEEQQSTEKRLLNLVLIKEGPFAGWIWVDRCGMCGAGLFWNMFKIGRTQFKVSWLKLFSPQEGVKMIGIQYKASFKSKSGPWAGVQSSPFQDGP